MRHLFISVIVCILSTGCAGNKNKADKPVHEPPTGEEAAVAMPKGGPVIRGDEAPPEAAEETTNTSDPSAAPDDGVANDGSTDEGATVTRAELDSFLDKGAPYVLTVVTFEPVRREGKFQGFQIVDVTRGAREFMTPQMRVGDIVTHVNGLRILKPDDLNQAWRSLNKADSIRIDFLRQSDPKHAVWVVK